MKFLYTKQFQKDLAKLSKAHQALTREKLERYQADQTYEDNSDNLSTITMKKAP